MDLKGEENVFKRGNSFCYLMSMEQGEVLIYILNTKYRRNERDAAPLGETRLSSF